MAPEPTARAGWEERAAERSPAVRRSRSRSIEQARVLVEAATRLADERGSSFTIQELVKEAGVAVQTFYRHFQSKDQLLLAVLEGMIADGCEHAAANAKDLPDPIVRLRFYVEGVVRNMVEGKVVRRQFVTSESFRLQQVVPGDLARANEPFVALLAVEIAAAQDAGTLSLGDPHRRAWFVTQLVAAVYHHYAFAPIADPQLGDELWDFCLHALGGSPRV